VIGPESFVLGKKELSERYISQSIFGFTASSFFVEEGVVIWKRINNLRVPSFKELAPELYTYLVLHLYSRIEHDGQHE